MRRYRRRESCEPHAGARSMVGHTCWTALMDVVLLMMIRRRWPVGERARGADGKKHTPASPAPRPPFAVVVVRERDPRYVVGRSRVVPPHRPLF